MQAGDQGNLTNRYPFVCRTLIFLTAAGKILLLKGSPHKKLWPNLYNGVGGHLEPGESVLEGARRELKEEASIDYAQLQLCAVATIDASQAAGVAIFIFRGQVDLANRSASDEGELEWVDANRLEDLPLVEDLHILLPKVLAWQPGEPVFFLHYERGASGQLVIRTSSSG